MEWPPRWLRETFMVFLFSSLWLPDWELGTQLGESRAYGPRVLRASVLGHCHLGAQWPFMSGSGKRAPDRESSENPVATSGKKPTKNMWAFSYFYMICFIYYLMGLGFLALDTSPHLFKSTQKRVDSLNWQNKKVSGLSLLSLLATIKCFSLCDYQP